MAGSYPYNPISLPQMTGGPKRPFQVITCDECGAMGRKIAHKSRLPPEAIEKFFREEGWRITRPEQGVCPACVKKEQEERRQKRASKQKESEVIMSKTFEPAKAPQPEKSPAVKATIAELYMMLDEYFDRVAKRYKPGWSDEIIAEKTGLSPEFIATRREQDFGKIEDDSIEKVLGDRLVKICDGIEKLMSEAGEIRKLLDGAKSKLAETEITICALRLAAQTAREAIRARNAK